MSEKELLIAQLEVVVYLARQAANDRDQAGFAREVWSVSQQAIDFLKKGA